MDQPVFWKVSNKKPPSEPINQFSLSKAVCILGVIMDLLSLLSVYWDVEHLRVCRKCFGVFLMSVYWDLSERNFSQGRGGLIGMIVKYDI